MKGREKEAELKKILEEKHQMFIELCKYIRDQLGVNSDNYETHPIVSYLVRLNKLVTQYIAECQDVKSKDSIEAIQKRFNDNYTYIVNRIAKQYYGLEIKTLPLYQEEIGESGEQLKETYSLALSSGATVWKPKGRLPSDEELLERMESEVTPLSRPPFKKIKVSSSPIPRGRAIMD